MGKQTKILESIMDHFSALQLTPIHKKDFVKFHADRIKGLFKTSLNKNEIIRRILNDVVLSNDEIVSLMRILYKKREGKK